MGFTRAHLLTVDKEFSLFGNPEHVLTRFSFMKSSPRMKHDDFFEKSVTVWLRLFHTRPISGHVPWRKTPPARNKLAVHQLALLLKIQPSRDGADKHTDTCLRELEG